jgi:hypothetical protein
LYKGPCNQIIIKSLINMSDDGFLTTLTVLISYIICDGPENLHANSQLVSLLIIIETLLILNECRFRIYYIIWFIMVYWILSFVIEKSANKIFSIIK